ncbi:hypothetical protein [Rhizobium mongolense]
MIPMNADVADVFAKKPMMALFDILAVFFRSPRHFRFHESDKPLQTLNDKIGQSSAFIGWQAVSVGEVPRPVDLLFYRDNALYRDMSRQRRRPIDSIGDIPESRTGMCRFKIDVPIALPSRMTRLYGAKSPYR